MYEHFLKKKILVEDPDKTMIVGPKLGIKQPPFNPAEDRIYLTGLSGSGRRILGRRLAEDLAMAYVELEHGGQSGALEPALNAKGVIVVLPPETAADPAAQEMMKATGRVFFLMADVPDILARLGLEAPDRESLVELHRELEPKLMAGLHFLLVPGETERQVAKVRELLGIHSKD